MNPTFPWAPDFTASTSHGPIAFHEWAGVSWVVLFSSPNESVQWAAELAQVDRLQHAWECVGTKMLGLLAAKRGLSRGAAAGSSEERAAPIAAPVISDPNHRVLRRFISRWRRAVTMRPVLIIDPSKRLRLTLSYPDGVVRDFREILRVVDGLRAAREYPAATGADWRRSDELVGARFWPKTAYQGAVDDGDPCRVRASGVEMPRLYPQIDASQAPSNDESWWQRIGMH
jgi:thioredoxin-dependent peroxiredoxin